MLSTNQKGCIAETAIIHQATKLGVGVFKAINDGSRYDLIFDLGDELVRVQCKWASRTGDVIAVPCYSCRRTAGGLLKRTYSADEVDAFAAYCAAVDKCYFIRFDQLIGDSGIHLRLTPTRNNQQRGNPLGRGVRVRRYTGHPWGRSSAGRAPPWHGGGQGFDPPRLH